MPQIIINRPPKNGTGRAADIGLNADVTIIDGGTRVDIPNADSVLIVSSAGELKIYTGQEAQDNTQKA